MLKSTLVQLFYSLSRKERNQLELFVHSPFHNQHQQVTALFHYLNALSTPSEKDLAKPAVFAHLFPGESYHDGKLRHVLSYLLKVMEDYITWQELQSRPVMPEFLLIDYYRNRNLEKSFHQHTAKVRKLQTTSPIRNQDYYLNNFHLNATLYHAVSERTPKEMDNLQQLTDNLDIFFIANKLQQAVSILTHQKLFQVAYQLPFLEETIQWIKRDQLTRIPIIAIYYNCYLLLTHKQDATHFRELKKNITEFGQHLSRVEKRDVYFNAINFCINQINRNKDEYFREVFSLYQLALAEEVLLENNILSPWTYKNIGTTGIRLEELEWVADFIKAYHPLVDEEYREDMYRYMQARLLMAHQDYESVIDKLQYFQTRDTFTNLDAKVLLIKAYYELGEFDLLEYVLNNFKQLLSRKKVLTYHKKNYSNFQKILGKIMNLPVGESAAKAKVVKQIREATILTEKEWLMEQLGE